MKRVHIVGRKNSGKTTLVVELVEYFASRGYNVGTIKHTHHQHELDTPGKDSYQHRGAGASAVGIIAPNMDAVFWPKQDTPTPEPYRRLDRLFADCDLVIVEGDLQATAPKIEVWRADTSTPPIAEQDDSIVAVVSDDRNSLSVPVWSRTDVASLASRLLELLGT